MASKTDSKIQIMLAHSNPLVLTAMSEFFERDHRFSVVATTATAEGFLGLATRVPVDVGIIDWKLPQLGAEKLIEVMREYDVAPKIIVYGDPEGDLPKLAMQAGAAGFASKSGAVEGLLDVCMDVAAGKMVFPFVDIRTLNQNPIHSLSKREKRLLEALSDGLSNAELSRELGISINTVKFHLSNIYDKLGVKNRGQATAFYFKSAQGSSS
ncbi:MAG: response regulator transcription factor [Cohaesibacter sp.]|nr:response regulator transcription factor [Cohaesibacter sp.]MCV6600024.1 response regulator transcription factor [Cohaesibacter sp.]